MRETHKDSAYFERYISTKDNIIARTQQKLSAGLIPDIRVLGAQFRICQHTLEKAIAQYSAGLEISVVKSTFLQALAQMLNGGWEQENNKVRQKKGGYCDYYQVEPHAFMLRMLALAYLFKVPDKDFLALVALIDRDKVSDNLYEFIIKARVPERQQTKAELYNFDKYIPVKVYKHLRQACETPDSAAAEKLVKLFLEKGFYHKHSGFHNLHKVDIDAYYGYWSVEAAAVTCIIGLDDSSYRDNQYYPKDIADYYRVK